MWQLRHFARLLIALALGCAIAFLPSMTANWPESGTLGALQFGILFLVVPGAIANMVLAGNVHSGSLWTVNIVNVAFYAGLAYWLFVRMARRKRES